jgi:hypothetical protein
MMPSIAHVFFRTAVVWLGVGISLGMYMGVSGNHALIAAHAHINLLGWVSSALFGAMYTLGAAPASGRWPVAHYVIYSFGVLLFMSGLSLEDFGVTGFKLLVGLGASLVCTGVLIFAFIVFFSKKSMGFSK